MNWGKKIALLYIGFIAMILFLVYRSVNTKIDLVATDYYARELQYQKVIDGTANANKLSAPVSVRRTDSGITVSLPPEHAGKPCVGSLYFYCASDKKRDKEIALAMDPSGVQTIPLAAVVQGNYTVKINWECGKQSYYSEVPFTQF